MRIAVVGAGISGLASAWLLGQNHQVTLFEANDYLGGHTHTHDIEIAGRRLAVDTGFIVHNPHHYPLLTRMFAELNVRSHDTCMSFSVRNETTGLEYNAHSLATIFCQPQNLVSPRFLGMLRDMVRFYRSAPQLLREPLPGPSLLCYLNQNRYGRAFIEDHLLPMASALWSAPASEVAKFPAAFLVRFMANHNMLSLATRLPWRVVCGGSASYVRALERSWRVDVRRRCAVRSVRRTDGQVEISSPAGAERFDHIVLACHSDQALGLLQDASAAERNVLGAIGYQRNAVVLHTDATFLPQRRRAWAAWNALVPSGTSRSATLSYCMNILQQLDTDRPIIVTLNPTRPVAAPSILRELEYEHPLFTADAVRAQQYRSLIQGKRSTWFAGAYWGFGFHEDGVRSAVEVAQGLGVAWAVPAAPARETAVLSEEAVAL